MTENAIYCINGEQLEQNIDLEIILCVIMCVLCVKKIHEMEGCEGIKHLFISII